MSTVQTTLQTVAAPAAPAAGTRAAGVAAAPDAAVTAASPAPRLAVTDLRVAFDTSRGRREVVHGVSFELAAGECLAVVGESGSGKSVTARSLVGLPGPGAVVRAERLEVHGRDLRAATDRQWRAVRGAQVGFVLQDALVALDPLRPVGKEIAEALALHGVSGRTERRRRAVALLDRVGVPRAAERARQRPDQLSGGLRQRALIASAIALDPDVVIADEPTTALDVTVQAQVLELLRATKQRGAGVLLISHDLAVVADLADRVLVMKDGRVLEEGTPQEVLRAPRHPYTHALVAAVPRLETRGRPLVPGAPALPPRAAASAGPAPGPGTGTGTGRGPVLEAEGLVRRFRTPGGGSLLAVDDVSFALERGETLGLVGESGSGKSTTARIALALERADAGEVRLLGGPWSTLAEARRRALRRRVGVVSQDPLSTFDPRWSTGRILVDAVPLDRYPTVAARRARAAELVALVGLDAAVLDRFPLRMSGGQRQRVAIARALAGAPDVVVLDEAVSALDVTIQAQVLDLLARLQRTLGVSYLFISHDLGVVGHLADRVLVMKDGRVVESGAAERLLTAPHHPYTRELVAAVPALEPARDIARGPATTGGLS
ncbi:dipeptide ABC transporter ATP-binding protein [Puerhibacterium sp. TATVAM-FAB25]|uniref:dipeptide ABC transporter ATP-binding protein n=1 Tax=Puerhibacterium sp. TATVAM-FAB25 TaxID=3093699 RepID=UPI00397D82C2